jgi:hypothetical protein
MTTIAAAAATTTITATATASRVDWVWTITQIRWFVGNLGVLKHDDSG